MEVTVEIIEGFKKTIDIPYSELPPVLELMFTEGNGYKAQRKETKISFRIFDYQEKIYRPTNPITMRFLGVFY